MTEEPPRALHEVDRLNRNRERVANVGYGDVGEDLDSSRSGIARRAEDQVIWQRPSCEDRKAHLQVQLQARLPDCGPTTDWGAQLV